MSKAYLIYIEISLFDAVVAKTSQIDMVFWVNLKKNINYTRSIEWILTK